VSLSGAIVIAASQAAQGGPWPAKAIQDTVAAIISQRPYQRSVRSTLFDRILEWIAALIRRLFSQIAEIPNAKWVLLTLAIVAVLAVAARIFLNSEAEERRRRARTGTVRGGADPWVDAERFAGSGNYTEAAHLLYRAVTERLAAAELIRLHPSKTSGDYARELRMRGALQHAEFRQFGRRYDHVLFGTGECDAATYASLREQASRINRPEARAA
jgi:hypothetical protein